MTLMADKIADALHVKELPSPDELQLPVKDSRPDSERIIEVLRRANFEYISRKTLIKAAHLPNKYISGALSAAKRRAVILDKRIGEDMYYRLGRPGEGELLPPIQRLRTPSNAEKVLDCLEGRDWMPGPDLADALKMTYPQLRVVLKDARLVGKIESRIKNGHRAFRLKPAAEVKPVMPPEVLAEVPASVEPVVPATPKARQKQGASRDRILEALKGRDWQSRGDLMRATELSAASFRGAITWPVTNGLVEKQIRGGLTYYRLKDVSPDEYARLLKTVPKPQAKAKAKAQPAPEPTPAPQAAPSPQPEPQAVPQPQAVQNLPAVASREPSQNPVYLTPSEDFKAWTDFDGNLLMAFGDGVVHMLTENHMKKLKTLITTAEMLREEK